MLYGKLSYKEYYCGFNDDAFMESFSLGKNPTL